MASTEIIERVRAIIAEQIGKDPAAISDDQSLTELGIESLDVLDILFALEEAFGIEIPFNANDPKAMDFDSVSAIARLVTALVNGDK